MTDTLVCNCDDEENEPRSICIFDWMTHSLRVQAHLGPLTDESIARLTADGLILLWRHGDYGFMVRPDPDQQKPDAS